MKTLLRQTALTLLLAAATLSAGAQNNKLVYKQAANPSIGITVANATGTDYKIRDAQGNVVLSGTVKSDKTFYIDTGKLGKGNYRFMIGSLVLQEFEIK